MDSLIVSLKSQFDNQGGAICDTSLK